MREFSVPATVTVSGEDNLSDMVFATAERFAGSVLYRRKTGDTWVDVSASEFANQVLAVAKGLLAAGLEPGDRVGLLCRTRYEWTVVDFAILAVGGITVPIYDTSSADQIEWVLSDSGAKATFIETSEHRERLGETADRLAHVWQIPDALDELAALGADRPDDDVHARRRQVGADDLASLVYTSGTTGRSKGCQLTHRNVLTEVRTIVDSAPELFNANASVLLFLPLAHVFARLIQFGGVYARVTLGHTADIRNLVPDLAQFRPTLILSVPRVFEKVYTVARQRAVASGRGRSFDLGESTAISWSKAQQRGHVGLRLRLTHAAFGRLLYERLRAALGGRCGAAISGGAPLGTRLGHFFNGIGIPIYEGYGLTETTAAATFNTPSQRKIGTVGRPLPGVTVRIADDSEVLIKGGIVFSGYWDNAAATEDVLTDDGWLRTGDLGKFDGDGYLRITGRKKELIVTASGKNVLPAELENRVLAHPLISQCMIVGDGQPFVAALVTLDADAVRDWRSRRGTPADTGADDPELHAEIQAAIDEANQAVSRAESIRKFVILPDEFSQQDGELTPTLKLKRDVVTKHYATEIEDLYQRG